MSLRPNVIEGYEPPKPMWVVIPEDSLLAINPPRLKMPRTEMWSDPFGHEHYAPTITRYEDCEIVVKPTPEHDRLFLNLWRQGEFAKFEVRMGTLKFVFKAMLTTFTARTSGISITLRISGPVDQLPYEPSSYERRYGRSPLEDVHRHLMLHDASYRYEQKMLEHRRAAMIHDAHERYFGPQPGDTITYGFEPHPMCKSQLDIKINVDGSLPEISKRILDSLKAHTPRINKETKVHRKLSKDQLKANRFYVGSIKAIEHAWGHKDLAAAVEHGTKMLESSNGDEQFIVKIIKVVRRKPVPVIVEDVK